MGNGASVRRIAMMPGRHASTVSRENRNGMIRRHPPKRTPVAPSMARELQEIVDETDNRPMRVLGCRTPVLLQCLLGGFGSVFPQCGLMVFPGAVIVSR